MSVVEVQGVESEVLTEPEPLVNV